MEFFEIAFLWQSYERITRRISRSPEAQYRLPSWRWAGWSEVIDLDTASATEFIRNTKGGPKRTKERCVESILSWRYHETAEAPGKPIFQSILAPKELWLENSTTENPEECCESPNPRSPSTYFYKHDAYPDEEFWYPIPLVQQGSTTPSIFAPCISCSTRRAWLCPSEQLPRKNGYRPILSLRIDGKIRAGILQPHDGLEASGKALQDPTRLVELVEIARGWCRDATSPWPGIDEIRHPERPKKGHWYEYY